MRSGPLRSGLASQLADVLRFASSARRSQCQCRQASPSPAKSASVVRARALNAGCHATGEFRRLMMLSLYSSSEGHRKSHHSYICMRVDVLKSTCLVFEFVARCCLCACCSLLEDPWLVISRAMRPLSQVVTIVILFVTRNHDFSSSA